MGHSKYNSPLISYLHNCKGSNYINFKLFDNSSNHTEELSESFLVKIKHKFQDLILNSEKF